MAEQKVSKEEQIGFHKGALSTLAKEREELLKMVNIVEQLMQMHIKSLKELGVDLEAQAKEIQSNTNSESKKTANIDELL
jgi:UDP-N-acetylglucosamine enolpyruvyl transferase